MGLLRSLFGLQPSLDRDARSFLAHLRMLDKQNAQRVSLRAARTIAHQVRTESDLGRAHGGSGRTMMGEHWEAAHLRSRAGLVLWLLGSDFSTADDMKDWGQFPLERVLADTERALIPNVADELVDLVISRGQQLRER